MFVADNVLADRPECEAGELEVSPGEGQADDGYPEELGAFLKALLKAKPELRINILSWNFPALYAAEREWNSAAKFTSETSDRLCFCSDSSLPLGSSQHQKIAVNDDDLLVLR